MILSKPYTNISISLLMAASIAIFAIFPEIFFSQLSLIRSEVDRGEIWRLLSGNFVHFGWAHSLMNMAAFLIFAFALSPAFSTARYITLVIFCGAIVGICVYLFNPEYETYAGLSGAIHGFFVAGLVINKRHNAWINIPLIGALFGKVALEHYPIFQATHLQNLLPVAVAYDAHLYGALAGLVFGISDLLITGFFNAKKTNA